MALVLSGCSMVAYRAPVIVPPPGGGDPSTTVGASVRCRSNVGPMGADVTISTLSAVVGAIVSSPSNDTESEWDVPLLAGYLFTAGVYASSAIYGGIRLTQCHDALVASARAKLGNKPLRLEFAPAEVPKPPAQRGADLPQPPATTAPPSQ